MTDFVHFSIDKPTRSQETRRVVRSNAIKYYWRQQKGKDTRRNKSKPSQTCEEKQQQSRRLVNKQKKNKSSLQLTTRTKPTDPATPIVTHTDDGDRQLPEKLRVSAVRPVAPADARFVSLVTLPTAANALTCQPCMWGTETVNVFESPALLESVFSFCRGWYGWLLPEVNTHHPQKPIEYARRLTSNKMLLAASYLAAVGGLDAERPFQCTGYEVTFKGTVLHQLQTKMQTLGSAISSDTIRTVLLLVSFDLCRMNDDAERHIRGLEGVLKMGNRTGLRSQEVFRIFEFLYLVTPLILGTIPLRSQLPDWYPNEYKGVIIWRLNSDNGDSFFGLLTTIFHDMALDQRRLHLHNLVKFDGTLSKMVQLVELLAHHTQQSSKLENAEDCTRDISRIEDILESLHELGHPTETGIIDRRACDSRLVVRAVHKTFRLLVDIAISCKSLEDPQNKSIVGPILSAFGHVDIETWKLIPSISQLILLTAISTCPSLSIRALLYVHLSRISLPSIMELCPFAWSDLRNITLKFLQFRVGLSVS